MSNKQARSKKILKNSLFGLAMEVVSLISGVILPRLIIRTYGSGVNGLISSITQFLAFFTILDSGIGGVSMAALYKPLAENNSIEVSRVVKATSNFFRKVAAAAGVYIVILSLFYPFLAKKSFDKTFVCVMILVLGVQTVAQYVFGFPYQLVLQADQKEYIHSIIRIFTIILNLIFSAALIIFGSSVLMMKFVSGLIFIIRPIVIYIFVTRKYSIDKNVLPDNAALSQKWHGIGYSIASFIHKRTDVFILTFLSSFENISIYSIHVFVLNGIDSVIGILTSSIQPAFGNMIAKNEAENLKNKFLVSVLLSNIVVTIVYTVTLMQISPFINLYIGNSSDVTYYQPVFAVLITIAEMIFCLRRPYQAMVIAAGHYKETTFGAYIEAGINIIVSLVLIRPLGLIGIAIGTISSMTFRIINYALYLKTNLVFLPLLDFFKRVTVTCINTLVVIILCHVIVIEKGTWGSWIICSLLYTSIAIVVTVTINYFVYRETFRDLIKIIASVLIPKKKTEIA